MSPAAIAEAPRPTGAKPACRHCGAPLGEDRLPGGEVVAVDLAGAGGDEAHAREPGEEVGAGGAHVAVGGEEDPHTPIVRAGSRTPRARAQAGRSNTPRPKSTGRTPKASMSRPMGA